MTAGTRGRLPCTVSIVTFSQPGMFTMRTWTIADTDADKLAAALGKPGQETMMPTDRGPAMVAFLREHAVVLDCGPGGPGDVAG